MHKTIIIHKIFLLLTVLLFLNSCWQKYWFDTYEVINESEHDVTIMAFWRSFDSQVICDTIFIAYGSSYKVSKQFGESHQPKGIFDLESPDSVIIIFDDSRYLRQVCENEYICSSTQKNLVDYHKYYTVTELDEKKDGRYLYSYTITKEDYDLAFITPKAASPYPATYAIQE